jgi:hypothetical protein
MLPVPIDDSGEPKAMMRINSQRGFASASPLFMLAAIGIIVTCAALSWPYVSKWIIIPIAVILSLFSLLSLEANIIVILLAIGYLAFHFISLLGS